MWDSVRETTHLACAWKAVVCDAKCSVVPVAPERIWKWGHRYRAKVGGTYFSAEKNILWSCPSTVLALQVQLVILVIAFVMVSTVWSVSCLLFFYSRCPPCPAICKSGGTCPPVPHEVSATEKACTNYKAMEWCRVDLTVTWKVYITRSNPRVCVLKKRRPGRGHFRPPGGVFANAVLLLEHYSGSYVEIFNWD